MTCSFQGMHCLICCHRRFIYISSLSYIQNRSIRHQKSSCQSGIEQFVRRYRHTSEQPILDNYAKVCISSTSVQHEMLSGTFEQEEQVLPPVTVTPDHVQLEQAPLPQAMTMLYPLLSTAPDPEIFSTVRPVIGIPLEGVPPSRSPPSQFCSMIMP